jgi:integrase
MNKRKRDYLFLRPGSQNWHIKLQSPGRRIEKSLGTPDRRQAELLALPLIAEHKAALLAKRPQPTWGYEYAPGREHVAPDGGRIIATDRELIYLDAAGSITRRAPNGALVFLVGGLTLKAANEKLGGRLVPIEHEPLDAAALRAAGGVAHWIGPPELSLRSFGNAALKSFVAEARPTVPKKNGDDAVLETYLKHANITGYYEREARNVWALYKTLTGSKPLKDADRDDGRKLVAHFEGEKLKSATMAKKVGWLNAMANLAIKEGRLKFNPFASVVPKRDDKQRRLPLTDADMKEIKRNFARLDEGDQMLFRLLATTGMRLSEAFEIDGEEKERAVRYVIVGHKTEQSKRRVPLPAAALPFLPKAIKGPLFARQDCRVRADPSDAASKRLNRFLNDCGIVDPRKVVHSLRHRAQDRLRAAGCPEDIRWALLGHEEKTIAAGYGEGFPVPLLRNWIDKIGF